MPPYLSFMSSLSLHHSFCEINFGSWCASLELRFKTLIQIRRLCRALLCHLDSTYVAASERKFRVAIPAGGGACGARVVWTRPPPDPRARGSLPVARPGADPQSFAFKAAGDLLIEIAGTTSKTTTKN